MTYEPPDNLPASLPQSCSPDMPITEPLSPGLKSLLELEPNADRAVAEIVRTPALLDEARIALPSLERTAKAPAGESGVQRVIGRRFVLFPQPDRSPEEWAEWWADYHEALSDMPAGAVEAAMVAWVKKPDSEFMPKPGQLRSLAMMSPNRDVRAYERARAAVEHVPERPAGTLAAPVLTPRGMPEPTTGDKARVAAMFRQYAEQDDARRAAAQPPERDDPRLAIPVKSDLTPAMRARIEQQGRA